MVDPDTGLGREYYDHRLRTVAEPFAAPTRVTEHPFPTSVEESRWV